VTREHGRQKFTNQRMRPAQGRAQLRHEKRRHEEGVTGQRQYARLAVHVAPDDAKTGVVKLLLMFGIDAEIAVVLLGGGDGAADRRDAACRIEADFHGLPDQRTR
jgi:hypothetical protein